MRQRQPGTLSLKARKYVSQKVKRLKGATEASKTTGAMSKREGYAARATATQLVLFLKV